MKQERGTVSITVPLLYEAEVKLKGERSFISQPFMRWVNVELPSYADVEAPIVCSWIGIDPKTNEAKTATRRYIDGNFYKPMSFNRVSADSRLKFNPMQKPFNPLRLKSIMEAGREHDEPAHYRASRSSTLEAELMNFQKRAKDYVIIEDIPWAKTPEPFFALRFDAWDGRCELETTIMELEDPSDPEYQADIAFRFSLQDVAKAEDFATSLLSLYDDREQAHNCTISDVQVHFPNLFNKNISNIDFRKFADTIVEIVAKGLIIRPTPTIMQWCKLRDAVENTPAIPSDAQVSEINSALKDLLELYEVNEEKSKIMVALEERLFSEPIYLPKI